ncbi:MAG TPA: hypothetical protein VK901_09980 [Nitrospiraceae bacterium]|nr:hypothetical protein [Nitrospiraceae bacterium]
MDAYKRGDYATALREWGPLAEPEDANEQYNIGGMCGFEKGTPPGFCAGATVA